MTKDFVFLKELLIRYAAPSVRRNLISSRDKIVDVNARVRMLAMPKGALPHFVVVGTQKGGTTQMYDELIRHSQIAPALVKEVHFFDDNYRKGEAWYHTFFPAAASSAIPTDQSAAGSSAVVTGEASPCYLFHPWAAQRMQETIPDAKIIVMLRDPVKRAYSHYHHEVRLGYETLPFVEAIEREEERLRGEREKMLNNPLYRGDCYMHYSYLARGRYIEQLPAWYEHFAPEQILVLSSEEFFQNTDKVLTQVFAFLGLPAQSWTRQKSHKSFSYPAMPAEAAAYLTQYFAPYNQQLYSFLNTDLGWK